MGMSIRRVNSEISHVVLGVRSAGRDFTFRYDASFDCLCMNSNDLNMTGAAFVELYFVMSSLFASRAYYAFGFLALTASVVALTTATVTILFTYFSLCAEEYR